MTRRTTSKLLVALVVVAVVSGAERADPSAIDACLGRDALAERVACLESSWSAAGLDAGDLEAVATLVDRDPAAAESVIPSLASSVDRSDSSTRANLAELRAEALRGLGRVGDAADAMLEAVALDDGTTALSWLGASGEPRWTETIDAGANRLVRAAEILVPAGRRDEARELLARALAAGAGDAARDLWDTAGGGAVPGLDSAPADLEAPPWYRPLPALEIPLLDGGTFRFDSARGKILLLDFWASWCPPCLEELPHLQALYDGEKDRGLVAVAINAEETERIARRTARSLDLTVPVGMYVDELDREFRISTLPTVIVADRRGRVRGRWDGFGPGLERVIADRVRGLLADDSVEAGEPVASVLAGRTLLDVVWRRKLALPMSSVAAMPSEDGASRVAALGRGQVFVLDDDGMHLGRFPVPPGVGTIRAARMAGADAPELMGYRGGGDTVVFFDPRSGRTRESKLPATIRDAAVLPGPEGDRLAFATEKGLYLKDAVGAAPERVGESVGTAGVAAGPGPDAIVTLGDDGKLREPRGDGTGSGGRPVPGGGRRLLWDPASEGVGIVPAAVRAWTTGSFFGDGRRTLVVAGQHGQLVAVDIATGEVRYRARWEGVVDLLGHDLDADGTDELLVVSGRSVTVLGHRPESGVRG